MAGKSRATSVPMMAMTTSSSTSEKAATDRGERTMRCSFKSSRNTSAASQGQSTKDHQHHGRRLWDSRNSGAAARTRRLPPSYVIGRVDDGIAISVGPIALRDELAIGGTPFRVVRLRRRVIRVEIAGQGF